MRRLTTRLIVPFLMLAGSPAFAADQFDLVCEGWKWTKMGGTAQEYDFRIRVDLTAKTWCEGDCKTASAIQSIADDKLVLLDDGTLNSRMEVAREATFDRKASKYHYRMLQTRPTDDYLEYQGNCKAAPFTPIP